MIAFLRGALYEKRESECVIDVQGVGYRVALSTLAAFRLPALGESVALRIRTVVREDALDLYGFATVEEEQLFLLLTSVSQVGPKLALAVLSGMEPAELCSALAKGEVARLTRIHGVGKKTAERLVLELKDKVKWVKTDDVSLTPVTDTDAELLSALKNLGYREERAQSAAEFVAAQFPQATLEQWVREALKWLRQQPS